MFMIQFCMKIIEGAMLEYIKLGEVRLCEARTYDHCSTMKNTLPILDFRLENCVPRFQFDFGYWIKYYTD